MASKDVVVDTSAWVEWCEASEVASRFGKQWPTQAHCIVPTMVQLELAKWLWRVTDRDKADEILGYTQQCLIVPLDTPLALHAAELHRQYKLSTADAIVYATAQARGATLLTCDAHFEGLPGVAYFGKRTKV